ncbi:FlgB family protein [Aliigemmobacter aestuarii]|uniref:FlgB family protein n=1 Tax=Aliigemmobacter aestuarii TaxID=1445661 RepID=A0A4S3MSH9_9RHOB|nr:FlgB family protein [Gemmobacter aestuarii]THD85536.1 FlgB family protein [Gemmobacter aestuarii]
MLQNLEILQMAQALASHAGARQGLTAANVANADTPGFKARDLPAFAEVYRVADPALNLRQTRPGHLGGPDDQAAGAVPSPGAMKPNGNTVSLEAEMVRAAQVRGQHDMALAVYRSAATMIRSSLGRG